jgi:PAS domain S-box-containing protein
MALPIVVYLLPLFIGAAVAFTLLVYTFFRRQTPGASSFSIMMVAIAVWMLGYAFELTSGTESAQYFWRNFIFLGIAAIPVTFLAFAFQYTSRQHRLPPRLIALISGWLIFSLGLVWSNPLHGLFWKHETYAAFVGPLVIYTSLPGPLFWPLILGIYILLGAGVFWLIRALSKDQRPLWLWIPPVLIALLIPALVNFTTALGLTPLAPLDFTAYAVGISLVVVAWAVMRIRFLEILPVAEHAIIEDMEDPLLIIGSNDRILFANRSASRIFNLPASALMGKPAKQTLGPWLGAPAIEPVPGSQTSDPDYLTSQREIFFEGQTGRKWYDLRLAPLKDQNNLPIGKLMQWHDITYLKQAETEAKSSQQHIQQLVDNSPNPIFSTDRKGYIQQWNPACITVFQYGSEMVGQSFQELLDPQYRVMIGEKVERVFESGQPFANIEIQYRCRDGSERFMASRLYPLFDTDGRPELCVFANTDITEQKYTQEELFRQLQELTTLHKVATACVEATNEDTLIEKVTHIIGEALYPDNFGILLVNETHDLLLKHPSYRDRTSSAPPSITIRTGIVGKVVLAGQACYSPDVTQEASYFEIDPQTRSELCVPLKIGERVIGVINAESFQPNDFSQADERLLSIIAGQLSIAIERLRAEADVHQRVQELQAITSISGAISSMLDRQQALDSIVAYATELSHSDASGIFFYNALLDRLYLVAAYGVGDTFMQILKTQGLPIEGTALGHAIQTRGPYQIADLYKEPGYTALVMADVEKLHAVLALPMMRGEQVIGGMTIWNRRPHHFSHSEEAFLQALANQSVNAVENARLFEIEREQRQLEEVLREVGSALSASLDPLSLYDTLLDQVSHLVPYDAANILVFDGGMARIDCMRGYEELGMNLAKQVQGLSLEVSLTPNLRKIYETHLPVIIADTASDPDWVPWLDYPLRSWMGVPVILQGQVAAIFSLDKFTPNFYRPEHADLLAIVAGQAGLALQNARLFDETRRRALYQETLNKIIVAAVTAPDLPSLLEKALNLVRNAIHAEKGGIWASGQCALFDLPQDVSPSIWQDSWTPGQRVPITTVVTDWQTIDDGSEQNEDQKANNGKARMAHLGLQATLNVPVLAGGRHVGGLLLASSVPRPWLPDEIALAEVIGRQIGVAAERLNLLAQTQAQAQQMKQIMDTVPDGVILIDANHRIVLANPAALQYLPILVDEMPGPNTSLVRLADQPIENVLTITPDKPWHELQVGPVSAELASEPFGAAGGLSEHVFECAARPLEIDVQTSGWVLVLRDVTQERQTMNRIQMQDRLATVGQLAAGIAHDFNNIMAAVVVYLDLIEMEPNLSKVGREQLNVIQNQIGRATSLIRQILGFSRRAVMEPVALDVMSFLRETSQLLEHLLPDDINLELHFQAGDYQVKADPSHLQQALMNLALNARDAMPSGGKLELNLEHLCLGPDQTPPLPDLHPGDWICLAVHDSGVGISPDILPHVFDPFFTTKPIGKGTGLGLAQAFGIVKQHGGTIGARSVLGKGSTFTIYLPSFTA